MRNQRGTSVPLPGTNGGSIHLNIVTGGNGDQGAFAKTINPQPDVSKFSEGLSRSISLRKPRKDFPKIKDFLKDLDDELEDELEDDSEPRSLVQYIDILTSYRLLGYTRIHEIICAVSETRIPGSEWLMDRISRKSAEKDLEIEINEGTANLIFQEMLSKFESINNA
jgi:hypothetical protein